MKLLTSLLKAANYEVETALNGKEAVEKFKTYKPDLVLLDVMMPVMDGYRACSLIKSDPETTSTPVIMVTALADRNAKLKGLDAGANEFLTKPIDRAELMIRVRNLLKVKEYEDFLVHHNQILEDQVRKRTYDLELARDEVEEAHKQTKESYIETIYRLTLAAEYKDEDTASHIRRISEYCKVISEVLGKAEEFVENIFYASPMHDIGKMGIPDKILLKPGKLTQEEFEVMKSHTTIGAKILKESKSDFLKAGEIIAISHHERWDGRGYPNGLKEEEIPLIGRIMNIVDQYDALRSRRPYKPGFTHEKAFEIIALGDGRTMPEHFDPEILEVFKQSSEKFNAIFEGHID